MKIVCQKGSFDLKKRDFEDHMVSFLASCSHRYDLHIGPQTLLYVNKIDADQPAHLRSLIGDDKQSIIDKQ